MGRLTGPAGGRHHVHAGGSHRLERPFNALSVVISNCRWHAGLTPSQLVVLAMREAVELEMSELSEEIGTALARRPRCVPPSLNVSTLADLTLTNVTQYAKDHIRSRFAVACPTLSLSVWMLNGRPPVQRGDSHVRQVVVRAVVPGGRWRQSRRLGGRCRIRSTASRARHVCPAGPAWDPRDADTRFARVRHHAACQQGYHRDTGLARELARIVTTWPLIGCHLRPYLPMGAYSAIQGRITLPRVPRPTPFLSSSSLGYSSALGHRVPRTTSF